MTTLLSILYSITGASTAPAKTYCSNCEKKTKQEKSAKYPDEDEPPIVRVCRECGEMNEYF